MSHLLGDRGVGMTLGGGLLDEAADDRRAINRRLVRGASTDGLGRGGALAPTGRRSLYETLGPSTPTHCSCHGGIPIWAEARMEHNNSLDRKSVV